MAGHRRRRAQKGQRRRRGETHAQHAGRLRHLQQSHEVAATHASGGSARREHEQAARDIEEPAGDAEYKAAQSDVSQLGATAGGWQSALFLLVGSGVTLWLLFSGHLKAAGEALGWLSAPKVQTSAAGKATGSGVTKAIKKLGAKYTVWVSGKDGKLHPMVINPNAK